MFETPAYLFPLTMIRGRRLHSAADHRAIVRFKQFGISLLSTARPVGDEQPRRTPHATRCRTYDKGDGPSGASI